MRLITLILSICIIGWSSYWWVVSRTMETSVKKWFEKNHMLFNSSYSNIGTSGFPNRVDITIKNFILDNYAPRVSVSTDTVQFLNLIYNKRHIISVIKPPIKIKQIGNFFQIDGPRIRSSLKLDQRKQPVELISEASNLKVSDHNNEEWELNEFLLATEKKFFSNQKGYRVHLKFSNLNIPKRYLYPNSKSPQTNTLLKTVVVDGDILLQKNFVKFSNLKLTIISDLTDINLSGDLSYSKDGLINGSLKFSIPNLRKILSHVEKNNWSNELLNKKTYGALNFIASQTTTTNKPLAIPVRFSDNAFFFGPLKIGNVNIEYLSSLIASILN